MMMTPEQEPRTRPARLPPPKVKNGRNLSVRTHPPHLRDRTICLQQALYQYPHPAQRRQPHDRLSAVSSGGRFGLSK